LLGLDRLRRILAKARGGEYRRSGKVYPFLGGRGCIEKRVIVDGEKSMSVSASAAVVGGVGDGMIVAESGRELKPCRSPSSTAQHDNDNSLRNGFRPPRTLFQL
jgi:hypothetical protein